MFSFQNHTEDTLRQELVTLQEEKLNYETTAKVDTYWILLMDLQKHYLAHKKPVHL